MDCYPITRIKDLFAGLHGGNFRYETSQQLFLDEDCKYLVVINTHRGLFRCNHLPFGISISSAPGIFQRAMETLLQDIPNVKVYLDDILITGSTEAHLQTLETVLDCLGKAGLRLQRRPPQWSIWGTRSMSWGCIQQTKMSEQCRRPQSQIMWLS